MVNLTSSTVGPIVISPGDSASVGQRITFDFEAGNYLLSPRIFVAFNEELKVIQSRSQLVVLKDVPLSFFDPHFLFLELLLVIACLVFAYLFAPNMLQTSKFVSATSARSSDPTNYDPEWVPQHHQITQSRKRARKTYWFQWGHDNAHYGLENVTNSSWIHPIFCWAYQRATVIIAFLRQFWLLATWVWCYHRRPSRIIDSTSLWLGYTFTCLFWEDFKSNEQMMDKARHFIAYSTKFDYLWMNRHLNHSRSILILAFQILLYVVLSRQTPL